ncbi:MAG: hypothetical protein AVDCRST_MAG22-3429, partial [uncultured Rubrobacteraceae bacterium]
AGNNAVTVGRARRHTRGAAGAYRRSPHPRHRLHHRQDPPGR